MKKTFLFSIICILSLYPVIAICQYACVNDMTKTYSLPAGDQAGTSVLCTNELGQTAVITNAAHSHGAQPYLCFTVMDGDLGILEQTEISAAPGLIPPGGRLLACDVRRFVRPLACGSGYVVAGAVSTASGSCGILLLLDDHGAYTTAQYYPDVSVWRGVEVTLDGFMAAGSREAYHRDEARFIRTDCRLDMIWARQIDNYHGPATCYVPYDSGATVLNAIRYMGGDLYALAGTTTWWADSSARPGDRNIVLAAIRADGSTLWQNSYGYTGSEIRSEESATALSIDLSDPVVPQIIVLGETVHRTITGCVLDTLPGTPANLLCGLNYRGDINWSRRIEVSDSSGGSRQFTDLACYGDRIAVSGHMRLPGSALILPAIYRFGRWGSFIEGRYYGDSTGLYALDSSAARIRIARDPMDQLEVIGRLQTGEILGIQSYGLILLRCDMEYGRLSAESTGMPRIGLPKKDIALTGRRLLMLTQRGSWTTAEHCRKIRL